MSENLWGDIPLDTIVVTPRKILEEQANNLTNVTQGVLEGVVSVDTSRNGRQMRFQLAIRVPQLNNYTYDVLSIIFPTVELYPCRVYDAGDEITYEAADEGEFKQMLQSVLQSTRVKRAVQGLLAQTAS